MPSPKQPAVPRIDVERHQRALLAAAADVLARDPDSSMADVAQAANLTRATLYRHFSNRQTLLKAIQAEALTRASETLFACRLDDGNALEVLRRVIGALGKHGMRFRIILMKASDASPRFLTQRDQVLAPVVDVVKRGQLEGDIRSDLSPEWIVTAMASLLIAAVRAAPTTKHSDADVSDLIFRTLVGGIATDNKTTDNKMTDNKTTGNKNSQAQN
ncbi:MULTISPECIES: TetR/AcrR family transcriptional regulator [unclassified Cryobacterium]|uniref:TetR/AcrR family transcriptional regulator n=1 Tax=unclassified Cryobacterium TaxID=2649013 RepID=UPI00141B1D1B|nr:MULTISPECIES: TetR/AcrR family transcriptional regulator [unclassified Cryobacterium]